MPLINLIQEQRLAARREQNRARTLLVVFAATSGVAVIGLGFFTFETERLKGEENRLRSQIKDVTPLLAKKEANTKEYDDLSPRLKTLEDAQTISARWNAILQHLSHQTPEGTWLTSLRSVSTDPEKPIEVNAMGIAKAQESVGELIMRMQNSPDLQDVKLKFTQEKVIQDLHGIEFEIDGCIMGTAADKPKDEAKEENK